MKFENPNWRVESPGPLPTGAVSHFLYLAKQIANQGRVQDILEEFKCRFAGGTCARSSTAFWAEADLSGYMEAASGNAPVFIEAFMNACQDVHELGYEVPSVNAINRALTGYNAGYQVADDTILGVNWVLREDKNAAEDAIDGDADKSAVLEDPELVAPQNLLHFPFKPDLIHAGGEPVAQKGLKAFLCHSSGDKLGVRELYRRLKDGGFDPWLDAVKLLPGDDWEAEIKKAVRQSHVVLVCLSKSSITRAGFVQKEIKFALDVADEQPEGRTYIVPVRLEDCDVPARLAKWHWVNLFEEDGYERLVQALNKRAAAL